MGKSKVLMGAVAVLGLSLASAPVWANVYASGLQPIGSDSLSFILNENADVGVTIEVWKVGGGMVYSENLGPKPKGTHTWTWNGTGYTAGDQFKLKVVAADDGYSSWTQISTDGTLTNFYGPRGVDVNRNPATANFGRIYVSESTGGTTTAGRTLTEGVFILNADVTDAVGQGNTGRKGGLTFGTTNSPFRVTIGPDDNVYLTDWSDSNSALIVGDPDFSSAAFLLANNNRQASGKCDNHGSIPTVYVEGTGAGRVVYTMDEDFDAGSDPNHGGIGSILRYDVGNATNYTGQPSIVYDDGAQGAFKGNIQNYYDDMVRASDGTWWVSQDRSGGTADTLTSLMQISADGSTVLWKSVPDLAANSLNDPVRRTRGIAWDPVHDWLVLGTYNAGKILIFDDDTKSVLYTITFASNATVRDVAVDAAGNIYAVDNITEWLRIWSPPDSANSFTTESYFTIIPEPATLVLLASSGLLLLRRRRA